MKLKKKAKDKKKRIKILDAIYNEEKHMIVWKVKFLKDGKIVKLVYSANDLAQAILNNPKVKLKPAEAIYFNEVMQGKEIWLQSEFVRNKLPGGIANLGENELINLNREIDQFPIFEAYEIATNE